MKGKKFDRGKLRWDLLPILALKEVVGVLTKGAEKYQDWNWVKVQPPSRYYRAAIGHINSYWLGEDKDSEWGYSHLAHAICCLLFLLTYQLLGFKIDRQDNLMRKRREKGLPK